MLTENSRSSARMKLLDQALAGQSAEVRARVQNILLRYNVDVENEFFLIFTAIGHLLAIVEESPENWRSLFDEFEGELDGWATQNLRTLEAINRQSANTERMGLSLQGLSKSTTALKNETRESLLSLNKLRNSLDTALGKLNRTEENSRALVGRFSKTDARIQQLENFVVLSSSGSFVLLLVLALGGVWGYRQVAQRQELAEQILWVERERSGWMLEKANRAECVYGLKPADDPLCREGE